MAKYKTGDIVLVISCSRCGQCRYNVLGRVIRQDRDAGNGERYYCDIVYNFGADIRSGEREGSYIHNGKWCTCEDCMIPLYEMEIDDFVFVYDHTFMNAKYQTQT